MAAKSLVRVEWFPGLWKRVGFGIASVVAVSVASTIAYMALGLSFLDAAYQTVITVSTVGFREVGDTGPTTTGYKLVTIAVVLAGTSALLFTIGMAIEAAIEGQLSNRVRWRRMTKHLDALTGHVIVCGWGQVGRAITDDVLQAGQTVVVVSLEELEQTAGGPMFVQGDATNDDVLRRAGVERASALVVALDTDAANVYVTLSARSLNPELLIVGRATSKAAEPKLYQAGANRVVNPHEIGGARMASLIMSPNVADFMGVVMHDKELEFRLVEFTVAPGSVVEGSTAAEVGLEGHGALVALRLADGQFLSKPESSRRFEAHEILIMIGVRDELSPVEGLVSRPR